MLFKDLELGKKFIDCRAIPNNTTSIRAFVKIDSEGQVDEEKDGLGINLKTGRPHLFGLDHEILELEM